MNETKPLNLAGFTKLYKSLDINAINDKLDKCATPEEKTSLLDGLMHDIHAEFNDFMDMLRNIKSDLQKKAALKTDKKPATSAKKPAKPTKLSKPVKKDN